MTKEQEKRYYINFIKRFVFAPNDTLNVKRIKKQQLFKFNFIRDILKEEETESGGSFMDFPKDKVVEIINTLEDKMTDVRMNYIYLLRDYSIFCTGKENQFGQIRSSDISNIKKLRYATKDDVLALVFKEANPRAQALILGCYEGLNVDTEEFCSLNISAINDNDNTITLKRGNIPISSVLKVVLRKSSNVDDIKPYRTKGTNVRYDTSLGYVFAPKINRDGSLSYFKNKTLTAFMSKHGVVASTLERCGFLAGVFDISKEMGIDIMSVTTENLAVIDTVLQTDKGRELCLKYGIPENYQRYRIYHRIIELFQ